MITVASASIVIVIKKELRDLSLNSVVEIVQGLDDEVIKGKFGVAIFIIFSGGGDGESGAH